MQTLSVFRMAGFSAAFTIGLIGCHSNESSTPPPLSPLSPTSSTETKLTEPNEQSTSPCPNFTGTFVEHGTAQFVILNQTQCTSIQYETLNNRVILLMDGKSHSLTPNELFEFIPALNDLKITIAESTYEISNVTSQSLTLTVQYKAISNPHTLAGSIAFQMSVLTQDENGIQTYQVVQTAQTNNSNEDPWSETFEPSVWTRTYKEPAALTQKHQAERVQNEFSIATFLRHQDTGLGEANILSLAYTFSILPDCSTRFSNFWKDVSEIQEQKGWGPNPQHLLIQKLMQPTVSEVNAVLEKHEINLVLEDVK